MQVFETASTRFRQSRFGQIIVVTLLAAAVLALQACGGGSTSTNAPKTLGSIQITPASSLIPLLGTLQLKATGVYSNGDKQDLTANVSWSSSSTPSSTNYVTVDVNGLASGMALGTSVITATMGPVLGVTQLTTNTNGYTSNTIGILSVPYNKKEIDAAYMPQSQNINQQGMYTVQEVNLDAEQFNTLFPPVSALVTSIPMPPGFVPNITAASQASLKVLVASYNSPNIQVIDASNNATDTASNTVIATFLSPVTKAATFNGISCMICGVVINPANDQALLSTGQGYYMLDFNAGTFTALPTPSALPSANFLLDPINPNASFVLSPTYGQDPNVTGEAQIINLANDTVATNTTLGIPVPSAAGIDLLTNLGVIVDQQTGNQVLLNFGELQNPTAGTWIASSTVVQITGGCNPTPAPMTMIAVGVGVGPESKDHIIFSSQPSGNCVAVESLPDTAVTGAPDPTTMLYAYGTMPATPDGGTFVNGSDRNGIATFTSIFNKKDYGLLVSSNQNWIAKIALQNFVNLNAVNATLPVGQSVVLSNLSGREVTYYPTTQ